MKRSRNLIHFVLLLLEHNVGVLQHYNLRQWIQKQLHLSTLQWLIFHRLIRKVISNKCQRNIDPCTNNISKTEPIWVQANSQKLLKSPLSVTKSDFVVLGIMCSTMSHTVIIMIILLNDTIESIGHQYRPKNPERYLIQGKSLQI